MVKQFSLPFPFANALNVKNRSNMQHCSSEEPDQTLSPAMGQCGCQGNIPSAEGFTTREAQRL